MKYLSVVCFFPCLVLGWGCAPGGPTTDLGPVGDFSLTERDGPEAGLAALETIHGLERSHLWHAALADNLRRLGRTSDAARRLRTAVTLAPTETEKRLLQAKLKSKQEKTLREYLDSKSELSDGQILNAIRLIMSTPEFQLT